LAENGLNEFLAEGDKGRNSGSLEPVNNWGGLPAARVNDNGGVELAEKNKCRGGRGTKVRSAALIVYVEELELLRDSTVLGNLEEDLVLLGRSITDVSDGEFGGISLLSESSAGSLGRGRTNSLENPVDNVVLGSAAVVLALLAIPTMLRLDH
jgi:hypothetical protein